ncbi:MAG: helix-turn-helix domain-containing protein [Defluviitaleaceae bacterium]|nr:helix-turn-helix domain-containing protein [Defluviitaleaceae bacterium]
MDEKLKQLRLSFLCLGNIYDTDKVIEVQRNFEKYLLDNEDNEMKQLENTVYLLKAMIKYAEDYDISEAYELVEPVIRRLEYGDNAELINNNYNKKLLVCIIHLCARYTQALRVLNNLEANLKDYPIPKDVEEDFKVFIYINFVERLLYAKTVEKLDKEEEAKVTKLFVKYLGLARELCEKREMKHWLVILEFREGLFFKNSEKISECMYLAYATHEHNLYKGFHADFNKHLDIARVEKEFSKKLGEKIREERQKRGLSRQELARFLGLPETQVSNIERGHSSMRVDKLHILSFLFNIPMQEFIS